MSYLGSEEDQEWILNHGDLASGELVEGDAQPKNFLPDCHFCHSDAPKRPLHSERTPKTLPAPPTCASCHPKEAPTPTQPFGAPPLPLEKFTKVNPAPPYPETPRAVILAARGLDKPSSQALRIQAGLSTTSVSGPTAIRNSGAIQAQGTVPLGKGNLSFRAVGSENSPPQSQSFFPPLGQDGTAFDLEEAWASYRVGGDLNAAELSAGRFSTIGPQGRLSVDGARMTLSNPNGAVRALAGQSTQAPGLVVDLSGNMRAGSARTPLTLGGDYLYDPNRAYPHNLTVYANAAAQGRHASGMASFRSDSTPGSDTLTPFRKISFIGALSLFADRYRGITASGAWSLSPKRFESASPEERIDNLLTTGDPVSSTTTFTGDLSTTVYDWRFQYSFNNFSNRGDGPVSEEGNTSPASLSQHGGSVQYRPGEGPITLSTALRVTNFQVPAPLEAIPAASAQSVGGSFSGQSWSVGAKLGHEKNSGSFWTGPQSASDIWSAGLDFRLFSRRGFSLATQLVAQATGLDRLFMSLSYSPPLPTQRRPAESAPIAGEPAPYTRPASPFYPNPILQEESALPPHNLHAIELGIACLYCHDFEKPALPDGKINPKAGMMTVPEKEACTAVCHRPGHVRKGDAAYADWQKIMERVDRYDPKQNEFPVSGVVFAHRHPQDIAARLRGSDPQTKEGLLAFISARAPEREFSWLKAGIDDPASSLDVEATNAICITCHPDLESAKVATTANIITMPTCIDCHEKILDVTQAIIVKYNGDGDPENNVTRCGTCHGKGLDKPPKPKIHGNGNTTSHTAWRSTHFTQVESECATCHGSGSGSPCTSCHGDGKTGIEMPKMHRDDFGPTEWGSLAGHSAAVLINSSCGTCHTSKKNPPPLLPIRAFTHKYWNDCFPCHNALGVTGRSTFHSAGWASTSGVAHKVEINAIFGSAELCYACHLPNAPENNEDQGTADILADWDIQLGGGIYCSSCHTSARDEHADEIHSIIPSGRTRR